MKLKTSDIIKSVNLETGPRTFLDSFVKLGMSVDTKYSFQLYKAKKVIEERARGYDEYVQECAKRFGTQDGDQFRIAPDQMPEFQKAIEECLHEEFEVDLPEIDTDPSKLNLDMLDFELLEPVMNTPASE